MANSASFFEQDDDSLLFMGPVASNISLITLMVSNADGERLRSSSERPITIEPFNLHPAFDPTLLLVVLTSVIIIATASYFAIPIVGNSRSSIVNWSDDRFIQQSQSDDSHHQVIDRRHVLTFLIGASFVLLLLFLFRQLRIAVEALFALSGFFCTLIVFQQLSRLATASCVGRQQRDVCLTTRPTSAFIKFFSLEPEKERVSTCDIVTVMCSMALALLCTLMHVIPRLIYLISGRGIDTVTRMWMFQNILGASVCIVALQQIRVHSWKIATIFLCSALLYDVFWVFISPMIFKSSVMVEVASGRSQSSAPALPLPALLLFPRLDPMSQRERAFWAARTALQGVISFENFMMLGLGDIVLPGLWIVMMRHYDHLLPALTSRKIRLWAISITLYALSLFVTFFALIFMEKAQPALLWIVPFEMVMWYVASRHGLANKLWTSTIVELKDDLGSPHSAVNEASQEEEATLLTMEL